MAAWKLWDVLRKYKKSNEIIAALEIDYRTFIGPIEVLKGLVYAQNWLIRGLDP